MAIKEFIRMSDSTLISDSSRNFQALPRNRRSLMFYYLHNTFVGEKLFDQKTLEDNRKNPEIMADQENLTEIYDLNYTQYIIKDSEKSFLTDLDKIINSASNINNEEGAINFVYSLINLFFSRFIAYDNRLDELKKPFLWSAYPKNVKDELETESIEDESETESNSENLGGKKLSFEDKIQSIFRENTIYSEYLSSSNFDIFNIINKTVFAIASTDEDNEFRASNFFKSYFSGIKPVRIMSEIFAEYFDPENIRDLKIEFGQTIEGVKTKDLGVRTDACMFENELPIILLRVAKYNSDLEKFRFLTARLFFLEEQILKPHKNGKKKLCSAKLIA